MAQMKQIEDDVKNTIQPPAVSAPSEGDTNPDSADNTSSANTP
jgi:hypothetical protein